MLDVTFGEESGIRSWDDVSSVTTNVDRTPGTRPVIQIANQLGTVFSKLDCTPRWRERRMGTPAEAAG
jgi:hypothetical protein